MTTQTTTLIFKSTRCILRLGLLGAFTAAGPLLASGTGAPGSEQEQTASSTLVQIVRSAPERFIDVNAATAGRVRSSPRLRHRPGYGRHGRRR